MQGLLELPYNKDLILQSIKSGCISGLESVKYSNFYCHVLKLKEQQLDKYAKDIINILTETMAKDVAIYTFSFLGSHK